MSNKSAAAVHEFLALQKTVQEKNLGPVDNSRRYLRTLWQFWFSQATINVFADQEGLVSFAVTVLPTSFWNELRVMSVLPDKIGLSQDGMHYVPISWFSPSDYKEPAKKLITFEFWLSTLVIDRNPFRKR